MSGIQHGMLMATAINALINAGALTAIDTSLSPANASASFSISTTGVVTGTGDTSPSFNMITFGNPAKLQIRLTVTGGTGFSTGTIDTWLTIGSGPHSWSCSQSVVGVRNATGTYQVRDADTGIVLANGTFNCRAEETI